MATEGVRYLISLRDKNNTIRHVYDGLLTGIYNASSGNTVASLSLTRNDVCALANQNVASIRAFNGLTITAVTGDAGDVTLQLTNSSADDIGSDVVVRIMKSMLTI